MAGDEEICRYEPIRREYGLFVILRTSSDQTEGGHRKGINTVLVVRKITVYRSKGSVRNLLKIPVNTSGSGFSPFNLNRIASLRILFPSTETFPLHVLRLRLVLFTPRL